MSSRETRFNGLRTSLELITTIVLLAAAAVVLLDRTSGSTAARTGGDAPPDDLPLPTSPVSLEGAAIKGDPAAPVVIIEFAEFECPYCLRFVQETLPGLATKYIDTGQAQLAFRHFPLESIHRFALQAAQAAECARRQGQFWRMHDSIFQRPMQLQAATLAGRAAGLGLNTELFGECVAGDALAGIRGDQALGRELGVQGTPAFFFGYLTADGTVDVIARLSGARPLADFERVLQPLVASVSGPS